MPGVVLIAGMAEKPYVKEGYDCIGIDRGAFICMQHAIAMRCAIGDFDSVSIPEFKQLQNYTSIHKLPEHKDETDSEAAILYAIELGYDDIYLYGATGGRMDHELANIRLMTQRDYPLTLVNDENRLRVLKAGTYRIRKEYTYLSFLPMEDACISEENVAYPLDHREMKVCDIYGISNEILTEYADITIHYGSFLMIESKDKRS